MTDVRDAHDALLLRFNNLVEDYNDLLAKNKALVSDYNTLLDTSRAVAHEFDAAMSCVAYANTLKEAQSCTM